MNRPVLLLGLLVPLLVAGRLSADDNAVIPAVSTATSQIYPQVTCTSTDPAICADTLQLAEDTREQLAPLLKLGPVWRFPMRIHVVTPDDPLSARVHEEGVAAIIVDKTMEIDLVLPSSDPDAREAIQRQCVTALLWEKFFAPGQVFDLHTRLDVVPVWLIEGLREWLNEDPDCVREAIVKRAALNGRAPTLAEITSWQELSSDHLYGLWQRAFCYYLVNSLVQVGPRRDNFQQWLASLPGAHSVSANYLFPTESAWQRELFQAPERSLELVYTWEQTAAEFDNDQTFALALPGEKNVLIRTLDDVFSLPHDKVVIEALDQKSRVLIGLELRAHVSWRPIIALYRFALAGFISNKDPVQTRQLFEQARQHREAEIADHQKIIDYVNWFQVTHEDNSTSHFSSYFSLADELDRAQAPHPNPIRASLLQVESQLSSGN
ncbi:MAG: hypothetical protein LV481_03655 [Methylacidiphilales bacterium]|nr:hypothetical protein [Candidatus Methylacidiphilales bacterium]